MTEENTRSTLNFTPEVAIKAAGADGRLYTIMPGRLDGDVETADTYMVTVFNEKSIFKSVPESIKAPTLVDAMQACIDHETTERRRPAPVGLVFKPCVFFHATGAAGRRYSIEYDMGSFVQGTSYEYPAWVQQDGEQVPLGTWATLAHAIDGCNENERNKTVESPAREDGSAPQQDGAK